METIDILQKFWWLFVVFFGGMIALVWRTAIKTNYVMRQVDSVKNHDQDIKDLQGSVEDLKQDVSRVSASLDKHSTKQDGDMSAIMTLLLEISEALKAAPDIGPSLQNAHKDFQKHLVKRKETQK